jgi:mono/diheme cytochrome c family protein
LKKFLFNVGWFVRIWDEGTDMGRHTVSVFGLAAVAILSLLAGRMHGHTEISSRFTYNEHLFPVFQRQCGSCHVEGGVAPMSLLTYQDAFPWTQSIREEVLALRMPPWKAEDGFGDFSNGHVLPAAEIDMILEWSSGGYPEGPRDQRPTAKIPNLDWTLGTPTVELVLPEPFEIDALTSEAIRYFVLPTTLGGDRWITAVDVVPDARAIVRQVSIYIDIAGQARASDQADAGPGFVTGFDGEQPIAVWWPGQSAVKMDDVGYALPDGADIVARVLYKKTWISEGQAFTDQTRFGLHLTEGGVQTIEHTVVSFQGEPDGREIAFTYTFDQGVNLLGMLPEVEVDATELQVEGVLPDGSRLPLLLIRDPDSGWPTRYWFDRPRSLPSGSRIDVTATLRPGANRKAVASLFANGAAVRLLLDHTPGSGVAD